MAKKRLDYLLVEKRLTDSREQAKRLIMAGKVRVNGDPLSKAGSLVREDSEIELKGDRLPYVGRGGLKLEGALKDFNIKVKGLTALDVGASTGGFTDCLLQNGVKKVYAVDVGFGQMAWKIRSDPRVVCIEKKNARYLTLKDLGETVDLAVIDLSFISVKKVIKPVMSVLKKDGHIITLVKPQFEVGKGEVGKGGIVRDAEKQRKTLEDVSLFATEAGLTSLGETRSPITGARGNVEFFLHLTLK